MANRLFNIKEINEKNAIIDNAIRVLKTEFVGIHKQIDEVMNNVRTWYLYPQLQTRPLIVAIWGLSGTGKTQLVKRISQLLGIEKDFVYWNFASISECSSWEIEDQIEEQLSSENSRRMIVYDEFQYAATKNPSTGEEIEKKTGLKPFWELLDSGLIHKRPAFWNMRMPYRVLDYMTKINSRHKMEIVNGVWVNAQECLLGFTNYEKQKFSEIFRISNVENDSNTKPIQENIEAIIKCYDNIDNDFFIHESVMETVFRLNDNVKGQISDRFELYHKLRAMNCDEIIDYICDSYEDARKGYDLKFNDSIIFVIGNLDEAYEMSFNVNPDMSADQFRKITEKISIVDIKEALKTRFRNEQIARLGNIHVIYPSFSSQDFKDIIDLSLNSYKAETQKLIGYNLVFEDSVKQIVFDEGVYPTHGTRPIYSTVYEIVKSKLPNIIKNMYDNRLEDKVETIVYSFDYGTNKIYIKYNDKDGNELTQIKFDETHLRLKKLRDSDQKDDEQALCALHESGHFVVYSKLFGKIPEKLVSRATDSNTGGFLMEDIEAVKNKISKRDMLNEIKVLIAGYIAEKEIFGEEMTSGASSDIIKATKLASMLVRRFGMGDFLYATSNTNGPTDPEGFLVREDNQNYINFQIKEIISAAELEVRQIFMNTEWRQMLKDSALYLCEHSSMPQNKMQELYDKVSDKYKNIVRPSSFYRDKIAEL